MPLLLGQLAPNVSREPCRNCTPRARIRRVRYVHIGLNDFSPGNLCNINLTATQTFRAMSSTVQYDGLNVSGKTDRYNAYDRAARETSIGEPVRGIAPSGKSGSESGKIPFFEIARGTGPRT